MRWGCIMEKSRKLYQDCTNKAFLQVFPIQMLIILKILFVDFSYMEDHVIWKKLWYFNKLHLLRALYQFSGVRREFWVFMATPARTQYKICLNCSKENIHTCWKKLNFCICMNSWDEKYVKMITIKGERKHAW